MTTNPTADYVGLSRELAQTLEQLLGVQFIAPQDDAYSQLIDQSIDVLDRFNKADSYSHFNLKSLLKLAYDEALRNGEDPYAEILKTVAGRTKDCIKHFTDDQDVYEDIKDWLEYEASLELHNL